MGEQRGQDRAVLCSGDLGRSLQGPQKGDREMLQLQGLHWSRGGGTLPFTHGVWSSTMLMVMLGCQWEITSTGP